MELGGAQAYTEAQALTEEIRCAGIEPTSAAATPIYEAFRLGTIEDAERELVRVRAKATLSVRTSRSGSR